jgi:hypothetical protein
LIKNCFGNNFFVNGHVFLQTISISLSPGRGRLRGGEIAKKEAVIPMEVLRLLFHFPLPFAGITQTGSEGLPALKTGTLSPMSSPSYT